MRSGGHRPFVQPERESAGEAFCFGAAMITQDRLRELITYNPETGLFNHRVSRGSVRAGEVAGFKDSEGYVRIKLDGQSYRAHRLAFRYMTGAIPQDVDHHNLIKDDNRWSNLRIADHSQNQFNSRICSKNTSGYRGVVWEKARNKWRAFATIKGRRHYLGSFDSANLASEAYQAFAKQHHGEFFCADPLNLPRWNYRQNLTTPASPAGGN